MKLRQQQIDANWNRLLVLIETYSSQPRNLTALLSGLEVDIPVERDTDKPALIDAQGRTVTHELLLGFKRAPAAKGNHHAFEGGLVHHILEMWDHWCLIRDNYPQFEKAEPYISDDRVLTAIIAHDLHKAYRTFKMVNQDPWLAEYADDDTDTLMTHDTKTLWILGKFAVRMDKEQMNALLWAEGGFSEIKPKWTSVLAKLCYLLDEFSGNVLARLEQRTFLNHRMPVK